MKTAPSTIPLLVTLALLATGCGSAEPTATSSGASGTTSGTPTTAASSPTAAPGCAGGGGVSTGAIRFLGHVDLTGDGRQGEVGVSDATGPCGPTLHLSVDGRAVSVPVPSGPAVTSAYAVRLVGHTGDLLVTRQDSPRGGFQTRIFAYAGGRVSEVTSDGHPLVPFVATDTPGQHVLVDCQGDQVVVTQALPASAGPRLRTTSYRLDGASAARAVAERRAGDVQTKQLAADAVFPSCRVG